MTHYTAQTIEANFKRTALGRTTQKKLGDKRYANDAGYWDGGQCNWGAYHNLQEDCQTLAKFFTGITELKDSRKELINFNNQQDFEKNKQELLTKITDAINGLQMRTSNNSSIAGVCIIWNDFADYFSSIIKNFRKDLERLKTDIERVPYNEAKELQRLNIEESNLKREIEENERRARNETDDNKKKAFTLLIDQAKEDLKKLLERKSQLKTARLGDDFNPDQYIDDFLKKMEEKLSGRNRPPRPSPNPRQNNQTPNNSSNNTNANNSSSSTSSPNNSSSTPSNNQEQPFLQRYWKELLLGGAVLIGLYYITNQKSNDDDYTSDYY